MQVTKSKRETVYPATPSPGGVLELSYNDQIMAPIYTSLLLFFKEIPAQQEAASALLKTSLADTLSWFYPLAGRYRVKNAIGELEVVCNDEGADLYEAWVDCGFDSLLPNCDPRPDFDLLAPQLDVFADISRAPLLVAQITHFECGRICLGIRLHHIVCDGWSMCHFLSCWAKLAKAKVSSGGRNDDLDTIMQPYLDRSLLKARNPPSPTAEHPEYQTHIPNMDPSTWPPSTCKIYPFTPSAIEELRVRAAGSHADISRYTRFEALAAHLWRGVTYARELAPEQEIRLGMAVDGRQRFKPALPEGYFGNVVFHGYAVGQAGELVERPLSFGGDLVSSAVAKVNDAHMRSALDWVAKQVSPRLVFVAYSRPFVDLGISSWSRLPFYELDFGWGKPSHLRIPFAFPGLVVLLPSSLGEGHIDALVTLDAQQMSKFESYINHHV